MLRKLLKERTKVLDSLRIFGGRRAAGERGMRMPDGSPVPVEHIMKTFGVTRERAVEIAQRQTR
jgi:hypothetical protein